MNNEAHTDIETLPTMNEEIIQSIKENLKPPGNMKKEETIQAWIDDPDNLKEAVAKTSFNGLLGSIFPGLNW